MSTDPHPGERPETASEPHESAPGAESLAGQRLGDFEILEPIVAGPIATVYRARQASTDRVVALKVLAAPLGGCELAVARLEAEATAGAAVSHPGAAAVYGWGCADGRHFIVLELAEGESLATAQAREARRAADRARPIIRQVAEALEAVHAAGYIHCGIQPSNVVLSAAGEAKLVDFALARPLGEGLRDATRPDPVKVPFYYPPEAARPRSLDERSDLYQLGGLFYHLLAGQPPFQGADPEDTALLYARQDVPALSQVLRTAPVALCRLIHRLLSREPDARYQGAREVLEALGRIEALFARTAALRAPPAQPEPRKPEPRKREPRKREPRKPEPKPDEPPPRPTIAERAEAARLQQKRTLTLSAIAVGLCVVIAVVLFVVLPQWPAKRPPSSFELGQGPPPPPPAPTAPPAPRPRPPGPQPRPVLLLAAAAVTHGRGIRYEKVVDRDNIGFWADEDEWVHWDFEAAGAGTYEVRVVFAAIRDCRGHIYAVKVGDQEVRAKVYDTGGWGEFVTERIGTLTIDRPGKHTLEVRWVKRARKNPLMNLKAVTLRPVAPRRPGTR